MYLTLKLMYQTPNPKADVQVCGIDARSRNYLRDRLPNRRPVPSRFASDGYGPYGGFGPYGVGGIGGLGLAGPLAFI